VGLGTSAAVEKEHSKQKERGAKKKRHHVVVSVIMPEKRCRNHEGGSSSLWLEDGSSRLYRTRRTNLTGKMEPPHSKEARPLKKKKRRRRFFDDREGVNLDIILQIMGKRNSSAMSVSEGMHGPERKKSSSPESGGRGGVCDLLVEEKRPALDYGHRTGIITPEKG